MYDMGIGRGDSGLVSVSVRYNRLIGLGFVDIAESEDLSARSSGNS